MNDYQKINTLFKRDENNIIMPESLTCPEFEYLKDLKWECTEKIDGNNIHIDLSCDGFGDVGLSYHGRTSSANIPSHLHSKLRELITVDAMSSCFYEQIQDVLDGIYTISIYGEGYGNKIQKGGNYISNGVGFVLFDVRIGKWWLKRDACEEIAKKLNIPIVPIIGYMNISEAIEYVSKGFKSTISENKEYEAEGLVLKTPCGLLSRNGERIITKIKTIDFIKYNQIITHES